MTLTIPEDVRAKAEIYVGDAAGQEKTRLLLQETGLPLGLLPLRDIIECGYVEETGFVWLRQRRKVDHYFAKAGRHVSYGAEVSAVADKGRLKKITGVKAKEMLIWVTLHEICLEDVDAPPVAPNKLVCKAIGGLSRSFPAEAFQPDGPPPAAVKPAGAGAVSVAANGKPGAGEEDKVEAAATAEKQQQQDEAANKKQEEEAEKKPAAEEEAKKESAAAKEEEAGKSQEDAAAVEEKLKELSTDAVHAEAVAAKN